MAIYEGVITLGVSWHKGMGANCYTNGMLNFVVAGYARNRTARCLIPP